MIRCSGSNIYRATACPGSAVLPAVEEPSSAAATHGTNIHVFLDAVSKEGREKALAECSDRWPDMAGIFAAIDTDKLPAGNGAVFASEVSFAINAATGEALVIDRHDEAHVYHVGLGWIPGTADVVGVFEDQVVIYDYKTGFGDLPSPEESWQLKMLAYAAARAHGKHAATVGLIRIGPTGGSWTNTAELDEFALAAVGNDLQQMHQRLKEAEQQVAKNIQPPLSVGSWCKFCPVIRTCAAQTSMLRGLLDGPLPSTPEEMAALTGEQLGEIVVKVKQGMTRLELAWNSIKAIAESQPIPLGNGKMLASVEVTREKLEGQITYDTIRALHGEHAALAATTVEISTSKTQVSDALRKTVGGKGITKIINAALAEIRKNGGSKPSTYWKITEIDQGTPDPDGHLRAEE